MNCLQHIQHGYLEKYNQFFIRVGTVGALLLHVFRRPTWTYQDKHKDNWDDIGLYPAFGISKVPAGWAYTLDVFLLLITFSCLWVVPHVPKMTKKQMPSRIKVLTNLAFPLATIKLFDAILQLIVFISFGRTFWSLSPLEGFLFILCEPCFQSKLYKTMWRSLPYFGADKHN